MCVQSLAGIVQNSDSDSARVTAAGILLDRGWGKPATTHAGASGQGDIKVVIRHIVDGRDVPDEAKTIDLVPVPIEGGADE